MKQTSMTRLLVIVGIGAAAAALIYFSPKIFFTQPDKAEQLVQMKTGGTGTAFIIMDNRWKTGYRKSKGIDVHYESLGSTAGINKLIDHGFSIAFTHSPLTDEQKKKAESKGGEVTQIPVVLCAVVPAYNLQSLNNKTALKFTPDLLARIFLGKIDKWNHPEIKAVNDGVELPDTAIVVVHREDSSGTTQIFTEYLQEASEVWKEAKLAPSSDVQWPVGVGKKRNEGVAAHVLETEGAIGYVDLVQATAYSLPIGSVQNKDKSAFIEAKPETMTAAAKEIAGSLSDDLSFRLINKAGKDSYPISGAVWAVFYQKQDAAEHQKVVDFLHWVTHEGQQFAGKTAYAPLPEELVSRADEKLKLARAGK